MNSITLDPEKRAKRKIVRMAQRAVVYVGIDEVVDGDGEAREFTTPIGRAPRGYTPQDYAAQVGTMAVERLEASGRSGFVYDAAATEQASMKPRFTDTAVYDSEGRSLAMPTDKSLLDSQHMAGRLTLVLVRQTGEATQPSEIPPPSTTTTLA